MTGKKKIYKNRELNDKKVMLYKHITYKINYVNNFICQYWIHCCD